MRIIFACRTFLALLCLLPIAAQIHPTGAATHDDVQLNAFLVVMPDGQPRTVTLITGDRVTISPASRGISIHPGEGRSGIPFSRRYEATHDGKNARLLVIPEDALPLIATGKVDQQLFDVFQLVRWRYDDASRDNVPIIMTYGQTSARRLAAADLSIVGATVSAQLSSINATAVQVPKKQVQRVWESIAMGSPGARRSARTTALSSLSTAVSKIWLDRVLEPVLDRSVPQIGAPAVLAAGYTGRGVVVAVLDSGVDRLHPDLLGRVFDYRNFTEELDDDIVGHGTHVASIIGGSGAASNGQYRGVAPDAQLIAGKVCFVWGCPLSAIIEGIQWAVDEKHATIINLSLGGTDTPEVDPLEAAINQVTAEHGTLFVVAAGNTGTAPVESPASADAALAVGAIDRDGEIAFFSSRGPRLRDIAIKPEITAPGVGIVAARAANTTLGVPVGEHYVAVSGTSMATPHAAGAAALLSERFPDWKAQELKSALMAVAKPNPAAGVLAQGAGRLDVAAAITVPVYSIPSSVNLGTTLFPHHDDEPVSRTLTYHNISSDTLTLYMHLKTTGPDGTPSPAGMFTVHPAVLVVPAGGTAPVTVTANTSIATADGLYAGTLAALESADGGRVIHSAPLVIEREAEAYDLKLTHIDRQGQPATFYDTTLIPLDTFVFPPPEILSVPGEVTVRLPPGRYTLQSQIFSSGRSLLVSPILELTSAKALTVDARTAQPISITAPVAEPQGIVTELIWETRAQWGTWSSAFIFFDSVPPPNTANVGPRRTGFTSSLTQHWFATRTETDGTVHPEHYAAAWVEQGGFFTGLTRTVRREDMAKVDALYAPAHPSVTRAAVGIASVAADQTSRSFVLTNGELPFRQTEYFAIEPLVGWTNEMLFVTDDLPFAGELTSPVIHFPGPRQFHSRWNVAPYAPPTESSSRVAIRTGDLLQLQIPLFGDGDGHDGRISNSNTRLALLQDGRTLGEFFGNFASFLLPSEPATYRLEASATQDLVELSSRVQIAWTFRSGRVDGSANLPLLHVAFRPSLNELSEAAAGSVLQIPIRVRQEGRSQPPKVGKPTVDISFDDGQSWEPVPVILNGSQWNAVVTHPQHGGHVSLRTFVSDIFGNTVEETVVRAYTLRAP